MPHSWILQVTPSTRQKYWGRWLEDTFLLTNCIGHSTQSSSKATLKRGCSASVEGTCLKQFDGPSLPWTVAKLNVCKPTYVTQVHCWMVEKVYSPPWRTTLSLPSVLCCFVYNPGGKTSCFFWNFFERDLFISGSGFIFQQWHSVFSLSHHQQIPIFQALTPALHSRDM